MCSGSKPKPPAPPPPPPPPPPAPPPVAELDVAADKTPDSTAAKSKQQAKGRDSLRIQRQNGIGGGSIGAGLAIPRG